MAVQIYPLYYQYSNPPFSYVFKFTSSSSFILKIFSAAEKCVFKQPLASEQLGGEYIDRISHGKDLSTVLERLVTIGILSRKNFPLATKIDQLQRLIQTEDWATAEKMALEGLQEGNESEKKKYYELLEKIYTISNPDKLEQFWDFQGQSYIKASQFAEAEKIYEKALKRFKSFNITFALARTLSAQGQIEKSVQAYYKALEIAALSKEFKKVSLCVEEVRVIDPQINTLDRYQRMQFLMQAQLIEISETLQTQQRSLFKFLAVAPAQHQRNLFESILLNATVDGQIDIVKMIFQHPDFVPINLYYHNEPLIITAAQKGHEEIVQIFLTHPDINVSCKQRSGQQTALSIAEQAGFKNIVTILYNHSQTLEEDVIAFKKKPLGSVEHLHIHTYQGESNHQCLVVVGIDPKGDRRLLDILHPSRQTLKQNLAQLVHRGLKDVKCLTFNGSDPHGMRGQSPPFPIYEAHPAKNSYDSEREKISLQLGTNVATSYKELSEKIDDLVKSACVDPYNEAVIYRAIKLKGGGYFTE